MAENDQQATGTNNTATEGQQTDEAAKTAATASEAPKDQAPGDQTKPAEGEKPAPNAPEKYGEFKAPEGLVLDKAVIGEFEGLARELDLSQDNAQKIIDRIGPRLAQRQADQIKDAIETAQKQWVDAAKTDKEYGGDQFDNSISISRKAIEAFGTPELKQLLNDSGLGNHPEMIRFCLRIGKKISEDTHVAPSGANQAEKTPAQKLYG